MKLIFPTFAICLTFLVIMAETVSKLSVPFALPATTSINSVKPIINTMVKYRVVNMKNYIVITWSIPEKQEESNISIYSLSGRLLQVYPLHSKEGTMRVARESLRIANGIYLMVLTSGGFKKSVRVPFYH